MGIFRKKSAPVDNVTELPAGEAPRQEKRLRDQIVLDERGMVDMPFMLLTVLLAVIGVIMVFSASYARAYYEEGKATVFFVRQGIFALVGIGAMLFFSRWNYQSWRAIAFPMMAVVVGLLILVPIPGIGMEENGARRWIYIGFNFQPSEVAKTAVIMVFAAMMAHYKEKMQTFKYGIVPFVAILGVIAGLLALEPHFSAMIIIFSIGAVMMVLGGIKWRWVVVVGLLAVGVGAAYLALRGYASERITAWLDPWADKSDSSYQILQSLYAIGSGGLMGTGLGRGRQKYLYLPEEHNDYIFAIVCEELGFIGAMVILLLFALLIIRGFWIAMHARDRFGALLAAGIMTHIALQVFFNIGVVTNFLPATGISLPFFSYGGTALLMQMFEMGVVLNVSRHSNNQMLS